MKSEVVVPIVATVVSAIVSIAGILYTQNASLELERRKWDQSQREDARKSEMQALVDFSRELATAYQRSEYIVWRAEVMPETLKSSDFDEYQKEVRAQFPRLISSQMLLATQNRLAHDELAGIADDYRAMDERIVMAGKKISKNHFETMRILRLESNRIQRFEADLVRSLEKARAHIAGKNEDSKSVK